uniref:Uncharacterized protein n=1 Tax=Rhizophora mucronata TaxID=61149 RepID=A0A2P2Q7L5_RHIMU
MRQSLLFNLARKFRSLEDRVIG